MRKISDTIAQLAALKALPAGERVGRERSPDQLRLLPEFGSNPGALNAKYYLPRDLLEGSPLVVVLHGCTQTAAGYDHHSGWSQLADEAGFALLYPEQQRGNNPNLCFNWFLPGDIQRQSGEVLSIRQMVEAMILAHGIDRERIFVAGLSAGGAMAAAMLATYPEVFAGGAIIAGLAYGSAKTIPEAFDRMRGHGVPSEQDLQRNLRDASDHQGPWPKLSIWHGSADQTVAPSNAETIAAQWRGVHQFDKAPTYSEATGLLAKQVWCDPAGDAVVEINMVAGMGHGTPLAADLGSPGPFMLDVGLSSTREIAGFWGIAQVDGDRGSRSKLPQPQFFPPGARRKTLESSPPAILFSPRRVSPGAGVQKTIEDALRAAGLMR